MRKTAITILFFLSILSVSAITVHAQRDSLAGRRWNLVEANGRRVPRSTAYIAINSSLTRFNGHTGCNQMFGSVIVRGAARIDFSGIGTTRRFCERVAG